MLLLPINKDFFYVFDFFFFLFPSPPPFFFGLNEDFIDYVVLSKPPPTCICNHSGDEPRVYSLVACEPNAMPAVSNVCWPNWNTKSICYKNHGSWKKRKTMDQIPSFPTVELSNKRRKRKRGNTIINSEICNKLNK